MATLQGDLSILGLTVLLPNLLAAGREGMLVVSSEGDTRGFHLARGGVYVLSVGKRKARPLHDLLLRKGLLNDAQRAAVEAERKKTGEFLPAILTRMNLLEEAAIAGTLREYVQEELLEVLTATKGTFRFVEGPPAPGSVDGDHFVLDAALDINYLLMEAARRADEWELFLKEMPSPSHSFRLTPLGAAFVEKGLKDDVLSRVLPLLQQGATLAEIVKQTGLRRYPVWSAAFTLLNQGLIVPQTMKMPPVALDEIQSADTKRWGTDTEQRIASKRKDRPVILIGDDHEHYREIVRFILEREGFEVVEAANAGEVLDAIDTRKVDAILLDMVLPGMEGPDLCRRIKTAKRTRETPVIFVSARNRKEDVLRGLQSGAQDYIVKPFRKDVLLEKIKKSVEGM